MGFPRDPTTLLLSLHPIGKNVRAPKDTYKNIHGGTVYNSLKVGTTQMPVNNRVGKYVVIYLPNQNEYVTGTHNNMDKFHKYNVEQKKSDTKECIYCVILFI